jgi:DNA-binding protein H-NS
MSSELQTLLAKRADLEQQIVELQREERSSALAQVKALMAQHGLTASDLSSVRTVGTVAPKTRGSSGKVAPKYRDPVSGKTWSGRGLHPTWLKQALATGAKLTDFSI